MQNNVPKNEKIILKIIYEQIPTEIKCELSDILENVLTKFSKSNNINYSTIYFLYSGSTLPPDQLKKPINEIITTGDKNEKIMTLLVYHLEFEINQEDEIIIILIIESIKIKKAIGKKGEIIKNIINSSIKLELNWCTFKYKGNLINIEQKFDDIADGEDKNLLKIEITVNYTIPLIINFAFVECCRIYNYRIKCLLGDKINSIIEKYFDQNHLDSRDYNLYYENKIFDDYYSKIFYEIISEDKINNSLNNETDNGNTIKSLPLNDNLNESNQIKFNDKEKITILPVNERKIEIEIKVDRKRCCIIFKRQISDCCDKCKYDCKRNSRKIKCVIQSFFCLVVCFLFLSFVFL